MTIHSVVILLPICGWCHRCIAAAAALLSIICLSYSCHYLVKLRFTPLNVAAHSHQCSAVATIKSNISIPNDDEGHCQLHKRNGGSNCDQGVKLKYEADQSLIKKKKKN